MGAISGFDRDVEFGALGDHTEQPLVQDFYDVAASTADQARYPGKLGRIADHQAQPHDPAVADQSAQQDRGQQAGVDVAAAQDQPDLAAGEDFGMGEQGGEARCAGQFWRSLD